MDVLANVARNLSRQDEKESAVSMVERAANRRRGTIHAAQAGLEPMEKQAASQGGTHRPADHLQERRLTRALMERLPGLAERMHRHGVTIAQVARQAATLAERVAEIAHRRRAAQRAQEDYWKSVSKGAAQVSDEPRAQSQKHGQRR